MKRYLGPPPLDGKVHRWLQDLYRVLSFEEYAPTNRQALKPAFKVAAEKFVSSEDGVILFDVETKNLVWSADSQWLQINPQDKLDLTGGTLTGDLVLPNLTATGNVVALGNIVAINATLSGNLSAVNATLVGDLNAVNANLTGDLDADNATLLGNLNAVDATLSGNLGAVNATLTGDLAANNATLLGSISAVNAILSGNLGAVSATLTGDLAAGNATLSGDLGAVNVTLTGYLAADSATLLGNISAVNAILSGDISAVAANFSGALSAGTTTISGGMTVSGTLSAGTTTISGGMTISGTGPYLDLTETDQPSTHSREFLVMSGGGIYMQTRNSAGGFVSHDYIMHRGASGATSHSWQIQGVTQFRIEDGIIRPGITNDVDLGSSSYEFKDGYFAGSVSAETVVTDTLDATAAGAIIAVDAERLETPTYNPASGTGKGISLSFVNGPIYVQRNNTTGDGGYLYVGYRGTDMNFLVTADGGIDSAGEIDAAGGFAVNGNPTGLGATTPPQITDFTAELHPGFYRFTGPTAPGGPFTTAFNGACIVTRGGSDLTSLIAWRQSGSFDTVGKAWLGHRSGATGAILWTEIALASSFEDVGGYIDEFTLADDAASGRPAPAHGCVALVQTSSPTIGQGYPYDRAWALVRFHTTPSSDIDVIGAGTLVETTTGVLTGTTGTDVRLTLSPHSDLDLYVENRLGGPADVRIQWFRGLI